MPDTASSTGRPANGVLSDPEPSDRTGTPPATSAAEPAAQHYPSFGRRLAKALSFRNISALYLFVAMCAIFALWIPTTFLTTGTWRSLLANQSITCLVALALVVPLASGVFDLAVGSEVGLGAILSAWLLVNKGLPIALAVLLALAAGAVVGVFVAFLIVKARINSFIATLGVSSVLVALISWISDQQQILNVPPDYSKIATGQLFGIVYPVYYLLIVAFILWYVLERTAIGRRVYATGGNPDAAALAGVRTSRVILGATITCGVICGLAGLLVTSQLTAGDPTIGPGYLLPAIAAAVLGSTQLRGGRYNVWGTVIAAYVLATGVKGLQLAGAPVWIPELFNGLALLIAVGMAQLQRSPAAAGTSVIQRLFRRTNLRTQPENSPI